MTNPLTKKERDEIRTKVEHGIMTVGELSALFYTCDALEAETQNLRSLVKDICDEWNEECDNACDKFGHTETCKSVSIANAKRSLNEENSRLKNEVQMEHNNTIYHANEVGRLREALEFYADPETYFAWGFFPDSPHGDFGTDFDETEIGFKPGKRARQALKEGK